MGFISQSVFRHKSAFPGVSSGILGNEAGLLTSFLRSGDAGGTLTAGDMVVAESSLE